MFVIFCDLGFFILLTQLRYALLPAENWEKTEVAENIEKIIKLGTSCEMRIYEPMMNKYAFSLIFIHFFSQKQKLSQKTISFNCGVWRQRDRVTQDIVKKLSESDNINKMWEKSTISRVSWVSSVVDVLVACRSLRYVSCWNCYDSSSVLIFHVHRHWQPPRTWKRIRTKSNTCVNKTQVYSNLE